MQFADVVDPADIGMVRPRGGLGFSSRPRQGPALLATGDSALIGFHHAGLLRNLRPTPPLLPRGLPRMLLLIYGASVPLAGKFFCALSNPNPLATVTKLGTHI